MSAEDIEILKRRVCYSNEAENLHMKSICEVHNDEYLKWYTLNQKACCDPLKKHPSSNRKKSLKTISMNLSNTNPTVLIPGKKLCISCYSLLKSSKANDIKLPAVDSESTNVTDGDFTDPTFFMEQLNSSCDALDLSPVKVSKVSCNRKLQYMKRKVQKMNAAISTKAAAAIGAESLNEIQNVNNCADCTCLMEKLLNKFVTTTSFKQKVQILTLVPESWTIEQTVTYFSTTKYLVKKARKLVQLEGPLSTSSARKSFKVPYDTIQKVIDFYYNDDNTRVCPGKKDCLSVPTENGRVLKQKRLILHNLKDLYLAFKEQNDGAKIGFSKFCLLRPRECVTVGSRGIHSVCVCIHHQNVKLMLHAIHMQDYISLLQKLVCDIESEECMVHRCNKCPSPENLKDYLMHDDEIEMTFNITYKQWVKTDGAEMQTITMSTDEFVDALLTKLSHLCAHHFFSKAQSRYFVEAKSNLNADTAIIVADFSQNYTSVIQDAIQSVHWKKEQSTVHPFLIYVNNNDTVKSISTCVISDHLSHDTTTFWTFQKVVVNHLIKQFPQIKRIKYFSDGASSQYKNYKNFVNLCHHEEDYGVKAEWHFFASCHGKGACDGIGATVKRMATKASLQRPHNPILNAIDLYNFAKEFIKGVHIFYVGASEVEIATHQLIHRYETAKTISGTRSNHSFVPINSTQLLVSRVSNN